MVIANRFKNTRRISESLEKLVQNCHKCYIQSATVGFLISIELVHKADSILMPIRRLTEVPTLKSRFTGIEPYFMFVRIFFLGESRFKQQVKYVFIYDIKSIYCVTEHS